MSKQTEKNTNVQTEILRKIFDYTS